MNSFSKFFEAYSDMGKLSPQELKKGQLLEPVDGDNFKQVDGRVFHQALSRIIQNDTGRSSPKGLLANLSLYGVKEYQKMKCFIGKNNSSGFVLKDGDELISVFSSMGASGNAVVVEAIKQGAKRLDCFAEQDENGNIMNNGLVSLYSRHGFMVDQDMNEGTPGEPYSVQNGVSYFVDDNGQLQPDNPKVVVFMIKR